MIFCLSTSESDIYFLAYLPFLSTDPGKLYQHILKYTPWPSVKRYKKHKAVAHCQDVSNEILKFQKAWTGVSGIYKITFLSFRLFTYYGCSTNLGLRFKYHYFNGPKQNTFLGLFFKVFGWSNFSITVVEICSRENLYKRENWYLGKYQPLLNVLMTNNADPRVAGVNSMLTRSKISARLTGRKESDSTRAKKSAANIGLLNPFYGKGPGIKALNAAAEKAGFKVYVYDAATFTLVDGQPFRSLRTVAKVIPIGHSTLPRKLDTGKPFKGYYYFSSPQAKAPRIK
jgi:group I intron endonuclease